MPELVPAAPLSPEWHAARRAGVTATDIATILGLSSRDSQYSLFWRKMQQAPEQEETGRMRLGRELEPIIRDRWHEEHPDISIGFNSGQTFRNRERPWQMASPDKILWTPEPSATLELKSWADADRHAWDGGPPARVRAQVLWQMDVMDVAAGHVGVLFLPSGEFRSYVIEHERPCAAWRLEPGACLICADLELMREEGETFMRRLRLELPPPDPDSSAATLAAVRARFTRQPGKQAEVDPGLWQAYCQDKEARDRFDGYVHELEIKLREQAGEASVLTVGGQPVARRIIVDAQVKAHTRHQDYLKRIEPRGDGSE